MTNAIKNPSLGLKFWGHKSSSNEDSFTKVGFFVMDFGFYSLLIVLINIEILFIRNVDWLLRYIVNEVIQG